VKRAVDSRDTFNEFMKLVNLFTQGLIGRARLIQESKSFLGAEIMEQWREVLGWGESEERAAAQREHDEAFLPPGRPMPVLDRPSKEELNIRYGSYRRLPAEVS
jgi:paired amphipathic helix protein Sin3a